jgi:hypothetical protein
MRLRFVVPAVLVIWCGACGPVSPVGPDSSMVVDGSTLVSDSQAVDGSTGLDAVPADAPDLIFSDTDVDMAGTDIGQDWGDLNKPCSSPDDCDSGLCIETPGGSVCTITCIEECPDGWVCKGTDLFGADLTFVCVPRFWHVCDPCTDIDDCDMPDSVCVDVGEDGTFCSVTCLNDGQCPDHYSCEVADRSGDGWCVSETGSCLCGLGKEGQETDCEVTNDFGTCIGSLFCLGLDGWSKCDAAVPEAESCDDIDNDCDGDKDEDFPKKENGCDGDDADDCENGTWTCTEDGLDVECVNESKMDIVDVCDGMDNDCDGTADEDFPDLDKPCDSDDEDQCETGTWTCTQDGTSVECINESDVDIKDLCDGLDNDCDGSVDEDYPLLSTACDSDDTDQCANGTWTCTEDGEGVECINEEAVDIQEICDYEDNNCDGSIDEGFPLLGAECDGLDGDLCENGTGTCTQDGAGVECVNEDPVGILDVCDGLDNDCDGDIDEDFTLKGEPCDGDDADLCINGTWTCTEDHSGLECVNENPVGIPEICDGVDNDCDNEIDEGFSLKGQECDSDDGDLCKNGTFTCTGDGLGVECINENPVGILEVCDGKDNDCDGSLDEGFPDKGQACDGTDSDLCKKGTYTCTGDGLGVECVNENPQNIQEICDYVDNNCNGVTDELFPTLGHACDGNDSDQCKNGTFTCKPGGTAVECVNEDPTGLVEVCDNKDNDCNGVVDPEDSGNCTVFYKDVDNDGYGTNSDSKCLCKGLGQYDVIDATDCYDGSSAAYPSQEEWFTVHRGDGSFDYDCNGTGDQHWTQMASNCTLSLEICSGTGGWSGSAPSCGQSKTWKKHCHWVFQPLAGKVGCYFDDESRVQECH